MLRKDSQLQLQDSYESKTFLKSIKPQTTKVKEQNKENSTARVYSDQPLEFFFKKEIKKEPKSIYSTEQQSRFMKTYLDGKSEKNDSIDQRRKTQSPAIPLQNKQMSQERFKDPARRSQQSTSISNGQPKVNEFNIYKQQLNIPTSYLDAKIETKERTQTSPEKPLNDAKIYYISSVIKAFRTKGANSAKEHFIQNMQGLIISKKIKIPPVRKSILLPPTDKKTIIFDLDETLIHCNSNNLKPGDVLLNVQFDNGDNLDASINIRPYTQYILQSLSRYYELIIFTASHSNYANSVIDYIDPQKKWISHRFYRENCIQTEDGNFIKDLRIFSNRRIQDMLIVDNAPHSYLYQPQNGVPIIPYIDNKQDEVIFYYYIFFSKQNQELKSLLQYLQQFRKVSDVRELNQQQLKMNRFSEYDDPMDLLKYEFSDYL